MRKIAAAGHRLIDTGRALAVLGLGITLAGCLLDQDALVANQSTDVRQRHPIAIREGEHTVNLLIGVDRGGLLPAQRAEVVGFADSWQQERERLLQERESHRPGRPTRAPRRTRCVKSNQSSRPPGSRRGRS